LQPGAGGCKTQRPHNKFFIRKKQVFNERVRPPSRLIQVKYRFGRRDAKLLTLGALKKPKLLGRAWCGHARHIKRTGKI